MLKQEGDYELGGYCPVEMQERMPVTMGVFLQGAAEAYGRVAQAPTGSRKERAAQLMARLATALDAALAQDAVH